MSKVETKSIRYSWIDAKKATSIRDGEKNILKSTYEHSFQKMSCYLKYLGKNDDENGT